MTARLVGIPVLETERLRLRGPREADLEAEAAFYASDRARFVGGARPRGQVWRSIAAAAGHWAFRGWGPFSLEERATGAYVGRVGPWFPEGWPEPEILWTLMNGFEGRGYATEAARAALAHAYGPLGWTTAVSLIDPRNAASEGVARRLGARPEGEFVHPEGWRARVWRHAGPAALAAAAQAVPADNAAPNAAEEADR